MLGLIGRIGGGMDCWERYWTTRRRRRAIEWTVLGAVYLGALDLGALELEALDPGPLECGLPIDESCGIRHPEIRALNLEALDLGALDL